VAPAKPRGRDFAAEVAALKRSGRGLLEVSEGHVEFLHRTVMDYLRTREMSKYLNGKAPPQFNANLSLLKAFTAYIKCTKFPEFVDRTDFAQYTYSGMMSALQEALAHANLFEEDSIVYGLLDQLACCIPQMHTKTGQAFRNMWGNSSNPRQLVFLGTCDQRVPHWLPPPRSTQASRLLS